MPSLSSPAVFSGVPTFFRAACRDASSGGSGGFHWAGQTFAGALESLQPYDVELDEWAEEVERLAGLLVDRRFAEVERWLVEHFPRCMAIVPRRRRENFIHGMRAAVLE